MHNADASSRLELVLERFRSRKFARFAVLVLFALAGLAIFAPFIANDRPYVVESIDRPRFESARRTLSVAANELAALIATGRAAHEAERVDPSAPTFDAALELQAAAIETRIATMSASLAEPDRARLVEIRADSRALVAAAKRGEDRVAAAREFATRVATVARDSAPADGKLERDIERDAERDTARGGVQLVAAVTHPLIESLAPLEVACMVAWLGVLAAALVAKLAGARAPRRRTAAFAVLVLALAANFGWRAASGFGFVPATSSFKVAATRGELEIRRAIFAPIPFGYAETNLSEVDRAPSWLASSESARYAASRGSSDASGAQASIEVRFGEPAVDAPTRHLFGTDSLGRDLLARCLWGSRTSLTIGGAAALALSVIGVLLGALAGWFGGAIDFAVSRTIEVVQCFPAVFLIVFVLSVARPEGVGAAFAVVALIALFGWTHVARLLRAEVLRLRGQDFVVAARAIGASNARIVFVHLLPNALQPAIVAAVFAAASALLLESSLSFLSLGVQGPMPSWGSVLGDSTSASVWWTAAFPGVFIFVTVLAVHRTGEALREALDPRSEG